MVAYVSNANEEFFLIRHAAAKMAGIPEKYISMELRENGEAEFDIDYRAGASPAQKDMFYKHYDFLLNTISIEEKTCSLLDGREIEIKIYDIPSYCLRDTDSVLKFGVLRGKEISAALTKRGIHDEYFNRKIEDAAKTKTPKPEDDAAPPDIPAHQLIAWKASDADFAEIIKALYDKGYIEASSLTDALNIAAPHFSRVNRKAKTLTQGIINRRDLGKAGRFDGIPPAEKPKKKN